MLRLLRCFQSVVSREGCNNDIKALKRAAFGFRNFRNFRARILLAANPAHHNI